MTGFTHKDGYMNDNVQIIVNPTTQAVSFVVPLPDATKIGTAASGSWGHAGRPGQRGGQAAGSGGLHIIGARPGDAPRARAALSKLRKQGGDAALLAQNLPYQNEDATGTTPVCFSQREETIAAARNENERDRITHGDRAAVKKEGADALRDAGVEYPDQLQKAWATEASDTGGMQDRLQLEAWDRAGRPQEVDVSYGMDVLLQGGRHSYGYEKSDARKAYDSIYNRTQEHLKSKGIGPDDTVVLYRGMSISGIHGAGQWKRGQTVNVMPRPLSSFSLSFATAKEFKHGEYGMNQVGRVFAVRVPAKAIFSTWRQGFGCMTENEVVVLGDYLKDIPWVVVD